MDLQKPVPAIPQNAMGSYDLRLLDVREGGLAPREKVPQEHYSAVIPACRIPRSRNTGLPKSYSWLPGVKISGRTVLVSITNAGTPVVARHQGWRQRVVGMGRWRRGG